MSKAFTKETDNDDDEPEKQDVSLTHHKNYVTPFGFSQLQTELRHLVSDERPKIVEIVRWSAGNGDRSENGDYIYGKRRLREIDRRIRYLTKRLESAEIVDPKLQQNLTRVYFGATVTYAKEDDTQQSIKLVGIDEADLMQGKVSWISPIAKSLLKAAAGDIVQLKTPAGTEELEVLTIKYEIVTF
jgi:transcription elongation factor GreB